MKFNYITIVKIITAMYFMLKKDMMCKNTQSGRQL